MKYSFEEKKRIVSVVSVLIFLFAAGVIWLMSGRIRNDGKADGSVRYVGLSQSGVDLKDGSEGATSCEDAETGLTVDSIGGSEISAGAVYGAQDASAAGGPFVSVHVCGAVGASGVYELKASARVGDAVDAAGGFKKNADVDYLNLAENIYDGQKIVVYTKKQVRSFGGKGPADGMNGINYDIYTKGYGSALLNINTASKEELMTLQGIGESKAADIISYRESNGRFNSTDELMNIPGIKEGVFSKISDNITV